MKQMIIQTLKNSATGFCFSSKNPNALNLLASILNSMGRKGEVVGVMDNALEMDPENVESHTNYGWAYLHKGDNEKALMHFQSALVA